MSKNYFNGPYYPAQDDPSAYSPTRDAMTDPHSEGMRVGAEGDQLVTRLYALADTLNGALPMEPRQLAQAIIREAADALEQLKIRRDELMDSLNAHMEDNADLKAKLAEAEGTIKEWSLGWQLADSEWRVRAEKAEAEVARLTLLWKDGERYLVGPEHAAASERADNAEKSLAEMNDAWSEARAEAAALRDVVLRTPHASWCAIHEGDECNCPRRQLIEALSQPSPGAAYQAYVRKLEAVVNLLGIYRAAPSWDALPPDMDEQLDEALVALEEKK